jgi:predicted metal-dependent enzyme (double-stranded beta helix superfamily)
MVETDTLAGYIDDVRDVFRTTQSPVRQGEQVADLTADVLAEEGWLEAELDAVGGDQVRLGALYTDDDYGHPEPGFRITAGRIDPGEEPAKSHLAHDHGLAWVVYGTYTGQREQTIYNWAYDESGVPHLEESAQLVQEKGDVIVVPPGEIHRQATVGTETSINVRIESLDMSGRPRHWYNVDDGAAEVSVEPTVA